MRVQNRSRKGERGTALIEFIPVLMVLLCVTFATIDFSRAIYQKQVLSSLTREGSNLSSRSTEPTKLQDAANSVIADSGTLKLGTQGRVIITEVTNSSGALLITDQYIAGTLQGKSRVGVKGTAASLPVTTPVVPQPGQLIYVTEIYSPFVPITPVGAFMRAGLPSTLYDVAYY